MARSLRASLVGLINPRRWKAGQAALRTASLRACSSLGRALAWHARGSGFDPRRVHKQERWQSTEQGRGHERGDCWQLGESTACPCACSSPVEHSPDAGDDRVRLPARAHLGP